MSWEAPTPALLDALLVSLLPRNPWALCSRLACVNSSWLELIRQWRSELLSVDLSCGNISDSALREVSRRCPKLQVLQLSQRSSLADRLVAAGSRWYHLKSTDYAACALLSLASILAVAESCPRLQRVDLSSVGIAAMALRELPAEIVEAEGTSLVQALASHCPLLRSLDFSHCYELVGNDALRALAASPCASLLEVLDLTGCELVTDVGVNAITESCANLLELGLGSCRQVRYPHARAQTLTSRTPRSLLVTRPLL